MCFGVVLCWKEECDSVGADAFFAAFETKVLGGCCFDRHLSGFDAEDGGDAFTHLRDIRAYLGLLCDDNAVDVAYTVAVFEEQFVAMAQQEFAVDVLVFRVVVGEVFADVA